MLDNGGTAAAKLVLSQKEIKARGTCSKAREGTPSQKSIGKLQALGFATKAD
jgi:hypothetical protein